MRVDVSLGFIDDTWDSFAEVEEDLKMALDALTQLREAEKLGLVSFVGAKVGESYETDKGHRGIPFIVTVDLNEAEIAAKMEEA
jgi:hypothetical protein